MKIKLNTEPKLIPSNDVKITHFELLYVFPKQDFEDYYNMEILVDLMSLYSLKYQTRDSFNEINDLNYIANYDVDFYTKGNTRFLSISFMLPGSGIFDDFDLKKSLKIVKEHIFKSIILADDYSEVFNIQYERYLNKLNTSLSDPKNLFNDMWSELYDFKHNYYNSVNDYLKALKNSSIERVKELYKKLVLKGDYVTFITGNINDKDYYKSTFEEVFKTKKHDFSLDVDYELKYKPDLFGHVDKTTQNAQSIIRVAYYKENTTKRDKYLLMFLNCCLFRRENNILFNNMRLKNDLVYSCGSTFVKQLDTIEITAYLSKENINKALVVIDECINELLDEELFKIAKEKLLKQDSITFISYLDDDFRKYKDTKDKMFKFESFKDEYEELSSITYEEIKECITSLKKVAELIMIGDRND